MWRALTQLPSLVTELIALHRESNSLTRELIALLSGRSAVTPMTPARLHPLVARTLAQGNAPAAGQRRRVYTERDVSFHTREDDQRMQEMQEQAQNPLQPPLPTSSRPSRDRPSPQTSQPDPADEGDDLLHP